MPVAVAISGEHARPLLEKINGILGDLSDAIMPWMFGLLGLVLLADSAAYLFTGEGLIQF